MDFSTFLQTFKSCCLYLNLSFLSPRLPWTYESFLSLRLNLLIVSWSLSFHVYLEISLIIASHIWDFSDSTFIFRESWTLLITTQMSLFQWFPWLKKLIILKFQNMSLIDPCRTFYFIYLFFICSEFCHTLKWNSHGFTCVPHPDPPPTSLSTRSL